MSEQNTAGAAGSRPIDLSYVENSLIRRAVFLEFATHAVVSLNTVIKLVEKDDEIVGAELDDAIERSWNVVRESLRLASPFVKRRLKDRADSIEAAAFSAGLHAHAAGRA